MLIEVDCSLVGMELKMSLFHMNLELVGYMWAEMEPVGYMWAEMELVGYMWAEMELVGYMLVGMLLVGHMLVGMELVGCMWAALEGCKKIVMELELHIYFLPLGLERSRTHHCLEL